MQDRARLAVTLSTWPTALVDTLLTLGFLRRHPIDTLLTPLPTHRHDADTFLTPPIVQRHLVDTILTVLFWPDIFWTLFWHSFLGPILFWYYFDTMLIRFWYCFDTFCFGSCVLDTSCDTPVGHLWLGGLFIDTLDCKCVPCGVPQDTVCSFSVCLSIRRYLLPCIICVIFWNSKRSYLLSPYWTLIEPLLSPLSPLRPLGAMVILGQSGSLSLVALGP